MSDSSLARQAPIVGKTTPTVRFSASGGAKMQPTPAMITGVG